MKDDETSDPKVQVDHIHIELQKLIDHLRKDIGSIKDPKARALFETSAEVLTGVQTAFAHYREGKEEAWRD